MADSQRDQRSPTDLGRRIRRHREALGLSRQELASRASVDPGYLEWLESDAEARPGPTTLAKLGQALEVSTAVLTGGYRPPVGQPDPAGGAIDILDEPECWRLLRSQSVGRFVFLEGRGPVALPVNYVVLEEGRVAFRTLPHGPLARRAGQVRVSLEVDQFEESAREGWSVLLSGHADPVEMDALRSELPEPWAGGDRDAAFVLVAEEVSGRRVHPAGRPQPED